MVQTIQYVRVMPDFKAVVVAYRQFFFALLIQPDAVKSAFDGQCWIFFDTLFWPDKFYQHCLGLVRYTHKSFTLFSSPEVLPKPPKPRLFKAKSAQNIRPNDEPFIFLEKNITLQGGGASGSYVRSQQYM
jgi:hypothetical protein